MGVRKYLTVLGTLWLGCRILFIFFSPLPNVPKPSRARSGRGRGRGPSNHSVCFGPSKVEQNFLLMSVEKAVTETDCGEACPSTFHHEPKWRNNVGIGARVSVKIALFTPHKKSAQEKARLTGQCLIVSSPQISWASSFASRCFGPMAAARAAAPPETRRGLDPHDPDVLTTTMIDEAFFIM